MKIVAWVIGVLIGLVVLYMRAQAKARKKWLERMDLPGLWHWQEGDSQLALSGQMGGGQFVRREGGQESFGQWVLRGSRLTLISETYKQQLELHFHKPGHIGLEDETGERRLYVKETTNVVPLKPH